MSYECYDLADGGELRLWRNWIDTKEAWALFETLHDELPWQQREIRMFGKVIPEPRLSAWLGDPGASYRYSGREHAPAAWTSSLGKLREKVVDFLDHPFNSVLANMYRDGRDSMGWHADNERELGNNPVIASISLGESRRFWLRHPSAQPLRLVLDHGSLLEMRGTTQHHWKHCVPKESSERSARINLTFRKTATAFPAMG